ncbi:glycosyltransferase family 4 protein [Thalassospira sp.]|uniref:glycosyltransferase family 4 protein n=1 Tax=Thalassospira sp. TaxID=1912094 RepID=UPI003AA841AA
MVQATGGDFCIIRTHKTEPQRNWPQQTGPFSQIILPGIRWALSENRAIAITSSPVVHLAQFKPDIVILAGFGLAMWQAHRWCRTHNIPYIIRFDGWAQSDAVFNNRLRAKMRGVMIRHATAAIAASHPGKQWFLAHGMAVDKISLVPIAPSFAPLPGTAIPKFAQRPYDLLWCGRPTEPKGFVHFLAIAAALYRQGAISRICIAGVPTKDTASFTKKLARAGLCDITTILPPMAPHRLAEIYASARLFLLPSLGDAYGVAVIEAISCRTLVVASDQVGVAHDVLVAGETMLPLPLPFAPLGIKGWLTAIKRLLADPAYCDRHLNLQNHAILNVSPQQIARQTWNACRDALG